MTETAKLHRLDEYLSENSLESAWFATPQLFSWLTGGSNLVAREGESGIAAAGYDGETITVLTTNIEGERLVDEELADDVEVVEYQWYEQSLREALEEVASHPAATDVSWPGFDQVDCSALTQPLTAGDVERYREVSRETATVLETVARDVSPGDTERELAARLHHGLHERGIESPVVLVGGADRVQRYRHFTPTDVAVGSYAILTVVGVSHGLNVAATRTVAFDDAPSWLDERYETVARVAATTVNATQEVGEAGGTATDVFESIQTAYDELGHDDEWMRHHQGGALGYKSREWTATPTNEASVSLPMAFGWNPTVDGAKVEETILVTEDDIDVLTDTGEFPTLSVTGVDGETELTLPAILRR
ncbi:M24 family metallopeptidase [Haloferax sp. DFSO52]|uniref:M24 family metallopeptidase n=1 Tax=Haloferax sp. DFSO52 TaxID=3388505 RepID=UPI003A8AE5A6